VRDAARQPGAEWKIIEGDVGDLDGRHFAGADLVAGGVPCPTFSIAGRRLGRADERDLFPAALRLIAGIRPGRDAGKRARAGRRPVRRLPGRRDPAAPRLGYRLWWQEVQASEHGVPQLRPRFVLVALREPWAAWFRWPQPLPGPPPTVGDTLHDLMGARGWPGAAAWRAGAQRMVARLQGFPDSWAFSGRKTAAYRQVA